MAHFYVNKWIYHEISAQLSEVKVKVVPISGLSRREPELRQARPLLAYLFIRSQQPCLAWGGTSGSFEADRLIGHAKSGLGTIQWLIFSSQTISGMMVCLPGW